MLPLLLLVVQLLFFSVIATVSSVDRSHTHTHHDNLSLCSGAAYLTVRYNTPCDTSGTTETTPSALFDR